MKNSIKDLNTKILNIANLIDSRSYNNAIELMYSLEKEEICNCFHSAISSCTKDTLIIVADKIISDKTNETATYEIARLYNNFRYTSLLWIYIILNKHEKIISLYKSDAIFKTYIEYLKKTYKYTEFNYYLIIEVILTGVYIDDFYIREDHQYKSDRCKYLESLFLNMEKEMHWHMSYSFPDEKPSEHDICEYKAHQDLYNYYNEEQNFELLTISNNKCPCILLELASYHNNIFKDKNPYIYLISESLRSYNCDFEIIKIYI